MLFVVSLVYCVFNDTATTDIYTLSLHDALPIFQMQMLLEVLQELGQKLSTEHVPVSLEIGRANV